ncbi:MAG TPA: HD domain-containing protein [Acidobacteriota bacterium]|nr:HD domain-containing protein [Acidobacteriota bacterium]
MKDEILSIFPEINEIKDTKLREKVVATWVSAMNRSDLTLDDLRGMPFTLLVSEVNVTFVEHVRTVCRMCIACWDVLHDAYSERLKVDRDLLITSAMLADVGKVHEITKKDGKFVKSEPGKLLRHPFSGVGLAWEQGLPEEVLHVIGTHSKEAAGGRRSPEGIIFHHADFIDFELVGG